MFTQFIKLKLFFRRIRKVVYFYSSIMKVSFYDELFLIAISPGRDIEWLKRMLHKNDIHWKINKKFSDLWNYSFSNFMHLGFLEKFIQVFKLDVVMKWALLKTTIVATLWNNLSCKLKVMAQFLYILYITVNVVTCAKQKSMYSHVSTLTFDQHQFHKFFVLWNC